MYTSIENMPDASRVWIYQANRRLTPEEEKIIHDKTREFLENWTAHNEKLKASYELKYHYFLAIMIDEKAALASGCSIDKSVSLIKDLEKSLGISFLNRMLFAYKNADEVNVVPRETFEALLEKGEINDDTIVFDNLIQTRAGFESKWEIPLRDSWHSEMFK
jgi:hypothetical protein